MYLLDFIQLWIFKRWKGCKARSHFYYILRSFSNIDNSSFLETLYYEEFLKKIKVIFNKENIFYFVK